MRRSKTDSFIDEYCRRHGLKLLIDPELGRNDGLCYPESREIHLS